MKLLGPLLARRGRLPWVGAAGMVLAAAGCSEPSPGDEDCFVSRYATSGVQFTTRHGGSGEKHFIEINVGGVSLFDHDGDGLLDLYFCQGAALPGYTGEGPFTDALYRNEGNFQFRDVTARSGASDPDYTYSASCPDIDGDGDADLFLCNYGGNRLLLNDGAGRFEDRTEEAGVRDAAWSVSAAFADLDLDGDLDAYVANYVVYDLANGTVCGTVDKGPEWRSYCHPDVFEPQADQLLRNDGLSRSGTPLFTDVSAEAGILTTRGKALAVVPCDYDDDGDLDLYVANDATANTFWRNDGGLRFVDIALEVGISHNGLGRTESCMGSDAADVDGDGDFDFFSANLSEETNTLWINDRGYFIDETDLSGLAQDSLMFVGFGARLFDFDLDGDPDLAVANGHVIDNVSLYDPHQTYAQPAQLFRNLGRAKFELVREQAGEYFRTQQRVGRGLATGDLDNDGDQDLVIVNLMGQPEILENRTLHPGRKGPHWIGFALRGLAPNTQAIGARIRLRSGENVQIQEIRGVGSYLAWNDTRIVFGTGQTAAVDAIEVRWPTGQIEHLKTWQMDAYQTLTEPPR